MARILTTAAGSDIGIGAIQSLHRVGHETVSVDIDPRSAGLYLADYGEVVPPADSETWTAAMCDIVESYDVEAVVPLIDQEVRRVSTLRQTVPDNVPVIAPREELVRECVDKRDMYELLNGAGATVPETVNAVDENGELQLPGTGFPVIVKPRQGQGGAGVNRVESHAELSDVIEKSSHNPSELLVQELIDGKEYTSNVATTQDGRLISVVNKRVPQRNGYTAWGVTEDAPSIHESCVELFEQLDPRGPMNVQHMVDESGKPYVIEINPRFSGSSCLTVEAGVNEFDLLVRDALGDVVEPVTEYETGVNIIRYTDQIYVRDDELLQKNE